MADRGLRQSPGDAFSQLGAREHDLVRRRFRRSSTFITSADFQTPTTAALHGDRLGVVTAKFDTGFPPTASHYEVLIVAS